MRYCTLLIVVSLFFTFASDAKAQFSVTGMVVDSSNSPISNANVYATEMDSTTIKGYDYTNEKGNFYFQLPERKPYLFKKRIRYL